MPGLAAAAGGEDYGLAFEENKLAALAPITESAADAPAVRQEPLEVTLHVDIEPLVDRVLLERANHFQSGAVAHVGEARITVAAEIALENQSFLGAVEQRAPFFQFQYALGGFLGVDLSHTPVVQQLPAAHGVAKMDFPVVLGVDITHGCGDATFRHDGVSFTEERLADESRSDPLGRRFNSGTETGAAGADDNDVIFMGFVLCLSH